jgi:hypothetical protein
MLKVHILVTCSHRNGKAYLPVTETDDGQGHKYIRHIPCPSCEGSGNEPKWVDIKGFVKIMQQAVCSHNHTSSQGNRHFTAGDVWDDIAEVCNDCGTPLDKLEHLCYNYILQESIYSTIGADIRRRSCIFLQHFFANRQSSSIPPLWPSPSFTPHICICFYSFLARNE